MKKERYLKLIIGIFFIFLLTGCLAEDYDFSPPTVYVLTPDGSDSREILAEANIDWNDKKYNKETKDIQALAVKQNPINFNLGELVTLNLEDGVFDGGISVSLVANEVQRDVEFNEKDHNFYLPKEQGKYILIVDVETSRGNAQYVGNLVVQ